MSQKHDRPRADGQGADDQNKADWNSRCDDLKADSADGQLPPPPLAEIRLQGFLKGLEPIQSITDLTLEELPYGYRAAIRKVIKDAHLFELFEETAFRQIHKHGSTSAGKIKGEIKHLHQLEFCHYSRTLMGRLFQWKHPHFAERVAASKCILDTLDSAIKEGLIQRK
jgi:hypothetical protein